MITTFQPIDLPPHLLTSQTPLLYVNYTNNVIIVGGKRRECELVAPSIEADLNKSIVFYSDSLVVYRDTKDTPFVATVSPSDYQSLVDLYNASAVIDEDNSLTGWDLIRQTRNRLLNFSDWTQMPDSPLTDSQKADWLGYRQSLRDITSTYSEVEDVVFPDPPK